VRRIPILSVLMMMAVSVPALAQYSTTRVSVSSTEAQATDNSYNPSISADGRYVAFLSLASDLVPGDTNAHTDVFVRDRQTGTTERVNLGPNSVEANGDSFYPSISGNGRFVAFGSLASNLVANDTKGSYDIFVRDRQTSTTTRVSVASGGIQSAGGSYQAVISANGRYVAFLSTAADLVPADTNGYQDVFLHDRETGTTTRVNVSTAGAQANNHAFDPSISADGQVIVWDSPASNLVTGDSNNTYDVFVRDVKAGTTTRASVANGNIQANNASYDPSVSGDGRFVTFTSAATNLVAGGLPGLYIRDLKDGTTAGLVTGAGSPGAGRISGTGRHVCFLQASTTGPGSDLFLLDRETDTKTRLNLSPNGDPSNGTALYCSINVDGTAVAYHSPATNLVVGDTNNKYDIFVSAAPTTMALDKTSLNFAAVSNGASFVSQTGAQTLHLTQSGYGLVTWTAAPNQPWLQVSPASGSGSGDLTVSVVPNAGLPLTGTVTATLLVSVTGASNTLPPVTVNLTLVQNGTSKIPFGTVDTPTDNRTGVTGAVPFTGWALDDIEVTRVSICRAAFGSEVAPIDPNCGGAAEIFIGFAVFIDGARPDVQAAFPTYPLARRGGWGFMTLTNMLPNQGNGTYTFRMRAQDREGNWFLLGVRTMTCANASATLPFGTLDTPLQGGTASGSSYVNFGWALTPLPKTIPINGSTIHVLVDGLDVGTADYNHARSDIQALFPGYNNTNGAVGFRILDTTTLTNGLHTISWTVTDSGGAIEGLGSRFFTVTNGVGAMTAAVTAAATAARSTVDVDDLPIDATPLVGRRGWDLDAPFGIFVSGANGVTVVRSEEVNRVELQLGDGQYAGYLRTAAGLQPLPIGSRIDPTTNTFTWAPGVGFIGRYDFVFVRSTGGRAVSRRDVRVVLQPKGRGAVGPQVVIDIPTARTVVREPFMIGGWAIDLDAPTDTGVSTLHAWAYPAAGGAPIFLGAATYGGARPDVAAVHGDRFKDSGFGLIVQGLPAGDYDLALFAWSTETMNFVAPKTVRVHVNP
jgi:Tol biopolymer transport system component